MTTSKPQRRTARLKEKVMIRRIWHSYTTPENADAFEHLLEALVFPAIEGLRPPGYQNMELLRRVAGDEIEFIWVMNFDTTKNSVPSKTELNDPVSVPYAAQKLLTRWDERPAFYEVRQSRPTA
jgi:hypothetical protein